jgi:hypothetical protein
MYSITIKYTKWPQNIPNCRKIDQQLPLQGTIKFTQIGSFGLKTVNLATLVQAPDAHPIQLLKSIRVTR